MLGRIKNYFKFHPDNVGLHSFIIGVVLLFSVAFSINQVSAIVSIFVVFFGWQTTPHFWLGIMTILITICLSACYISNLLKKVYPNQSYLLYLSISVPIMVIISAPITVGLYKFYLHTGF